MNKIFFAYAHQYKTSDADMTSLTNDKIGK